MRKFFLLPLLWLSTQAFAQYSPFIYSAACESSIFDVPAQTCYTSGGGGGSYTFTLPLLNTSGTVSANVFGGASNSPPVVWTATQNVVVGAVGAIAKSGGSPNTWGDSGAFSTTSITGSGQVNGQVVQTGTENVIFGFSATNTGNSYTDVQFGFIGEGPTMYVYENGNNVYSAGGFQSTDVFSIGLAGGVVIYYKNNAPIYTSSQSPASTLFVKVAIYNNGDELSTAYFSGGGGTNGTSGIVPRPTAGQANYYLRGNGNWTPGGADTALDNLTSPTAVNQTLIAGAGGGLLADISALGSVDYVNRLLDDSSVNPSVDFGNRFLYYTDGSSPTVDWGNQVLYDSGGNQAMIWEFGNRQLNDSSGATSEDFDGRILYDPAGDAIINWSQGLGPANAIIISNPSGNGIISTANSTGTAGSNTFMGGSSTNTTNGATAAGAPVYITGGSATGPNDGSGSVAGGSVYVTAGTISGNSGTKTPGELVFTATPVGSGSGAVHGNATFNVNVLKLPSHSQDPNTGPLTGGEIYYNSSDGTIHIYNGSTFTWQSVTAH